MFACAHLLIGLTEPSKASSPTRHRPGRTVVRKPSQCQATYCQLGVDFSLHQGHSCRRTGFIGAALRWILSYAAGEKEAPNMTPLSSTVAFLNESRALATTPSSYPAAPAGSRTSKPHAACGRKTAGIAAASSVLASNAPASQCQF